MCSPDEVTRLLRSLYVFLLREYPFVVGVILCSGVTDVGSCLVDTTGLIRLEVDAHTIPSVELLQIRVSIAEVTTQSTLVALDKRVSHFFSLSQ